MRIRITIEENVKTFVIPDEELEGLGDDERKTFLEEEAYEAMREMLEWGWVETKAPPSGEA